MYCSWGWKDAAVIVEGKLRTGEAKLRLRFESVALHGVRLI